MIKNYLKIAWRNLWKNKVSSLVNLICLAVGMASCMLILVYLKDELSFNKFNANYENIYRIDWIKKKEGNKEYVAVTPIPLGKTAKEEIPDIKKLARLYQRSGAMEIKEVSSKGSPQKFQEQNVYFSDNEVFSIFTIPFIRGNTTKALTEPNKIVLTEQMAEKYFGDADPVGKFILYDTKLILQVSAVVKTMPENSDLQFDFLVSFETVFSAEAKENAEFMRTNWTYNPAYTYCYIPPHTDIKKVEASLNSMLYKHGDDRNRKMHAVELQPLSRIHLYCSDVGGNTSTSNIRHIYIFAGIACLILLIAAVNFINLATAQAGARSREVGMRKVLGAGKKQLIFQFLTEALLLSFVALILACVLTQIFLPVLNQLTNKNLSWQSWLNLKTIFLFGFIFFVTGISAGSYPAFFISRFNLVRSLKGKAGATSEKNLLRKVLLVSQFTISMILIIVAIIAFQQLQYLRNAPLGFQKDHVLCIPIFGSGASGLGNGIDGPMRQRMNGFSNELTKLSKIKSVTAASAMPGQWYIPGLVIPEGFTEQDNIFLHWVCVDYNYISSMNIPLVAGRDFSKQTGTDHLSAFIINESAVKKFGWKSPQEAIGKKFIRGDAENGKKGEIIGVIKDHHFNTLDQPVEALIMDVSVNRFSFFAVNIQPDHIPETLDFIKSQWDLVFPERVFEYSFLDSDIDALYQDNESLSKLIGYFAMIAVLLSCLGLFSLSSFLTLQRAKEIGIRKVLGAGVRRILFMLSLDFLKLVMISFLISAPLAFLITSKWLENYANRINIHWLVFALVGLFVLVVTALTVMLQSLGTAIANPIKSLRTE